MLEGKPFCLAKSGVAFLRGQFELTSSETQDTFCKTVAITEFGSFELSFNFKNENYTQELLAFQLAK